MIVRCLICMVLATASVFVARPAAADAMTCVLDRPVMFAELDWDSNRLHTALARYIIEMGYGCETDAIPGSTIPLLTGLARGDIDVMMEIWKDNVTAAWNKAEAAGKVVSLGINFADAIQGWWVPRYLVDGDKARGIAAAAPGLRHVRDLARYKQLVRDPEEPAKGRFYNCILGWNCEVVNTNKLKAYGLDRHFTNFRTGTGAALAAAIASNYARGKPFVAYYWGPTWVLGKFDLVMLDEPPYDKAVFEALASGADTSRATAYPLVEVVVGVNARFRDKARGLAGFLTRYQMTSALISAALVYMNDHEGATVEDAALDFLRTRPEVWKAWVPPSIVARVQATLD